MPRWRRLDDLAAVLQPLDQQHDDPGHDGVRHADGNLNTAGFSKNVTQISNQTPDAADATEDQFAHCRRRS